MRAKRYLQNSKELRIAVLIPCFNEEQTVSRVIQDFKRALPHAAVYVYDNNSRDATVIQAVASGAIVRHEPRQGKGNVVRRMFADVDADVYVLVDGDATYEASVAPKLVTGLVEGQLDMVNAARVPEHDNLYRPGHGLGNKLLTGIVSTIFGRQFSDILTGYRVLSRRFVKSFPAMSSGFEIETELTVHALELRMPVSEVVTRYFKRPEGSMSKLSTFRDGLKILGTILKLCKRERPFLFFGAIAIVLAAVSLALFAPILISYVQTGLVPRLPTAILSASLMILASLSGTCGLILDTVTRGRQEVKRLHYLGFPAPSAAVAQGERSQSETAPQW